MTTNIERAVNIVRRELDISYGELNGTVEDAVQALSDVGLLRVNTPAPQVIRTVEELEALDPGTVIITPENDSANVGVILAELEHFGWKPCLPAVVITNGEQVRAARKALEEA